MVEEALHELVALPQIQRALSDKFKDRFGLEGSRKRITEEFDRDATLSWRGALKRSLGGTQDQYAEDLKAHVREKVRKRLEDGE